MILYNANKGLVFVIKKIRPLSFSIISLLIILSVFFSITVSAENVYANIESASVKIEIPDTMSVSNSTTSNSNLIYTAIAEVTDDSSRKAEIRAEKNDLSQEIYNLKYLTKEQINNEIANLYSTGSNMFGKTFKNVTASSFREEKDYLIFLLYNKENNKNENSAIAYTVINGCLITINYKVDSGSLTSSDKNTFGNLAETIDVTTIYEKPSRVDIPKIYSTLFSVVICTAIGIFIILIVYYITHRITDVGSRRKLADKYYDELQKEGLMDEEQEVDSYEDIIRKKPKPPIPPKPPEEEEPVIPGTYNPKYSANSSLLIEDEWEDFDPEKLFNVPDTDVDDFAQDESVAKYRDELTSEIYESNSPRSYVSRSQPGRADSAKRYAKMFIGSDVDHRKREEPNKQVSADPEYDEKMSEIERRYRQRQEERRNGSTSKKKKNTSTRRTSLSRNSSSNSSRSTRKSDYNSRTRNSSSQRRNNENDAFEMFQTDSYWDKYR